MSQPGATPCRRRIRSTTSRWALVLLWIVAALPTHRASADEVRLIAPVGSRAALQKIIPEFERKTGHKVVATFGTGGPIRQQAIRGEAFDVAVVQPPVDELVASGNVVKDSQTLIATVAVALAVRKGQPKPDISTPEALKRTLLAAKSITFPDPARGAGAGISFQRTLEQLGIAEEMKPRITVSAGGAVAMALLASGGVDLGLTYRSEMEEPGIDPVASLPPAVSPPTQLMAFVYARTASPAAAKALVEYLASPAAASLYVMNGLQPATVK